MTKEEVALIERVQQGQEEAYNELFQLYYGKAYAIAYRIMNCNADAHDAAQEALIEVYHSISKLKEPKYFYSWLIRIVVSKCNRIYRKNKEYYMDPQRIQSVQNYEEKRAYMLPDKTSDNTIDHDILIGLIYSLKPQMAEVLDMMYLHQMKLEEIAQVLNIPLSTVKSRVVRGRIMLKQRIHEYEQLEKRKISFHAYLPLSLLGMIYLWETGKAAGKKILVSIKDYATGSALQTACVVSYSLLMISGAAFTIIDHQPLQSHYTNPQDHRNETSNDVFNNTFQPVQYKNELITTSNDAYYICLNWALDENEMKTKSEEEISYILPVYNALKSKNDAYYKRLTERGWTTSFENLMKL